MLITSLDSVPSSDRRRELALWLALFAVVIVSRAPNLILDPRLWWYEATWFLSYARQNDFLASLLFVKVGVASYLNLSVNIPATIAGQLVPLKFAPTVTTVWSFVMQLIPFALVLFGRSRIWATHRQRLVVCLILLFGPPVGSPEVWLNSGNSQVFCGIVGLILLCEDTTRISGSKRWLYLGLLGFCALSGPYSAFLAPAYVVRAHLEGTADSKRYAWILVSAAALQAAAYLFTRYAYPFSPSRFTGSFWGMRLTVLFVNDVIGAVFGNDLTPGIARWLGLHRIVHHHPNDIQFMRLAGWTSLLGISAVVWFLSRRPRGRFDLLLPFSFVLLLTALFFLTPNASYRYVVVPGTALLLALFSVSQSRGPTWRRVTGTALLAVSIAAGLVWYWKDVPRRYSPFGRVGGRPTWSKEVDKWLANPRYCLRIWPYPRSTSIRLPLLPKSGPIDPSSYVEVKPFSLISTGKETTRILPVSGLPTTFRLILKMRSTQPSEKTRLRIILEDRHGLRLNATGISGFRWHEDYWIENLSYRIPLRKGSEFADVRKIRLVLKSKTDMPHRVLFEKFAVEPANIGGLEPLLPMRPRRYQTFEFESSGRAVKVVE